VLLCPAALVSTTPPFERQPMQYFTSHSFPRRVIHRLPALSIWCSSVWCRATLRSTTSTTPRTCSAIARRGISTVYATISCSVHCWTLCATKIHAVRVTTVALQFTNHGREFLLKCLDTLRDNLVRVETADSFNVVEEARGSGFEVEINVRGLGPTVEVDAFFVLGPRMSLLALPSKS
jgi:hypothetical protein